MDVLYRSPFTRAILAVVGAITGLTLAFGDTQKWRATPSLHWLAQAPISLRLWGVAFVVYAGLLLFDRTRAVAYAVGTVLFGAFTISMVATLDLRSTAPRNVVSIAAMFDVVAYHALSIRTALTAQELR